MVIYVDGLAEPRQINSGALHSELVSLLSSGVDARALDRMVNHFAFPYAPPVWLVPMPSACPECATRRNLADNPGA